MTRQQRRLIHRNGGDLKPAPLTRHFLNGAPRPRFSNHSIAQINRHTGKPHEHKREIARRLRRIA